MKRVEVAPGVHVALDDGMVGRAPEPADVVAAQAFPAWRASEYVLARTVLRALVAEVLDERTARGPLSALPGGRPVLTERPDLSVSVSHDGDRVAVALGVGAEVGVDVQRPLPASKGLLRKCCTPTARESLRALPDARRDHEFAWLWTVQEACVKAQGTGMAGAPWRIPVEVGQRAGTWNEHHWLSLRGRVEVPVSCAYREIA